MSREVVLFENFSKRRNSTARPLTAGSSVPFVLKENTSVVNPTIRLRANLDVNYNYAYIPSWGLWYYIADRATLANGFVEYTLSVDPLATLRDNIFNTRAFVVYSTSSYSAMLNDDRVSQLEGRSRTARAHVTPFVTNPYNGTFLLATVSMGAGVCIYACNTSQFYGVVGALVAGGANLWDSLSKLFNGAMGGIIGCRYVPIDLSYWSGTIQEIEIGNYPTGTTAKALELAQAHFTDEVTLDIPWQYDDFRRNSNFTRIYLELPFVGVVDISSENLYNRSSIKLKVEADGYTGIINYGVYTVTDLQQDILIATYSGQFGRQVPIANGQVDAQGFFNAMISGGENIAGAFVTGSPSALMNVGRSAIGATVSAMKKDFSVIGGFGGGYGENIIDHYRIVAITTNSRTDPSELRSLYGSPCNKVLRIGDLSGYVQTSGIAIDCATFDGIREEAEQLVDSGIYLE